MLNITPEDERLYRMIIHEREVTLCTIAQASDLVEAEKSSSDNHCRVMKQAVEMGEAGHIPDTYDIQQFHRDMFPHGGDWRQSEVWFKGCEVTPPPAYRVSSLMREYADDSKWWLTFSKEDAYIRLAHLHIQFEFTHPFTDGNGRIGRILLNCYAAYLNLPFIKISHHEKDQYIDCLQYKDENALAQLFKECSM